MPVASPGQRTSYPLRHRSRQQCEFSRFENMSAVSANTLMVARNDREKDGAAHSPNPTYAPAATALPSSSANRRMRNLAENAPNPRKRSRNTEATRGQRQLDKASRFTEGSVPDPVAVAQGACATAASFSAGRRVGAAILS